MRVAVIGAGPAGLTAALALAKGGANVELFEAASHVGGLSRSLDLWGQRVDLGPHRFFSNNKRVNQFWLGVVGDDYCMVDRLTRVYFRGQLVDYPIRPVNALRALGSFEAAACVASYLWKKVTSKLHPFPNRQAKGGDEASFESWVTDRFGPRLFDIFFRHYSEKLWGIPCTELSSDFAMQRIRQFSLGKAIANALIPRRSSQHKTLVDQFAYPKGGTGAVYETMARSIRQLGGSIHNECPIKQIERTSMGISGICLPSNERRSFDHVISTIPLTKLVDGLASARWPIPSSVQDAASQLAFRNTLLVYLHIGSDSVFDDQWLYIQCPKVQAGRVTNFRNWAPELHGDSATTILSVEQWCNDQDPIWQEDDAVLIRHSVDELRRIGLLGERAFVLDGQVQRIPRAYPVYQKGYQDHVSQIRDYLSGFQGLSVIGRSGAFKYNNQDHSILMGLLAAENILHNAKHDLWSINSDFDTYQEKALITAAGLTPTS